jgi:L-fucose mutarotase
MLKGLDPLLTADLLYALRAMGHGDELVLCDANFPADAVAHHTTLGRVVRLAGASAPQAARAILSVLPLDSFVEHPAACMEAADQAEPLAVHREVQTEVDAANGRPTPLAPVERFAFYERARHAYCVVATGERRFYGCFIFAKGVIPPS